MLLVMMEPLKGGKSPVRVSVCRVLNLQGVQ